MNLAIDKRIRTIYAAAFTLLLFFYVLVFYTNRQMQQQTKLVIQTNEVISQIDVVVSDIKDGETGILGYVTMKDKIFLEPFFKSQSNITKNLKTLSGLISDNKLQLKRLDTLKLLIAKKYLLMDSTREVFTRNGLVLPAVNLPIVYKAKVAVDSIKALSLKMQQTEVVLLNARNVERNSFRNAFTLFNITSLIIALMLAVYSLITYKNENKEKNNYRAELEKKVQDLKNVNIELIKLKSNEKFAATGRIARTIAHEVRNPLTNITLAAEQLKETAPKDEETMLYFDMIKRNGERINQLVSELLNATKNIDLKPTKQSINIILDEALELAKDRVQLQHLKVEKIYSNDICQVLVDKEQIKIAFLNLIVNAIEAIEKGDGKLVLQTKGENGKCVVVIKDNGSGIDKDNFSKLFEPYFTNKQKGNGLGLTNTQNIILNHMGNIHVESEPGIGTAFTITLNFAD